MSKKQPSRRSKAAPVVKTSIQPSVPQEVQQELKQEVQRAVPQDAKQELKQDAKHKAKPAVRPDPPQAIGQGTQYTTQADIRGVLIQLAGARLLLPNATIAEVLSYAPPEPVDAVPDWLLGKIRWRGWQLPLVAFAELAGVGKEPAGLGSKVVVLKALGGNAKAPYFAILSQGFPRLVTVSQEGLIPDTDGAELPLGVQSRVIMNEDTAFVPDLGTVEALITDALAHAA